MPSIAARQEPPASVSALVIEEVLADSNAAKAGLEVGDRVLSYDGKALASPAALMAVQDNGVNARDVALRVQRGDQAMTVTAGPGRLGITVRPEIDPAALVPYEQGRSAQAARNTEAVLTAWTKAARVLEDAGETGNAAWLLGRMGDIHESLRHWTEANAAHASAWQLLRNHSDAAALSRTLGAQGRCHFNSSDFPTAQRWFELAERVDAAAGFEMWVAIDLSNLGNTAYNRGDLQGASEYHRRALAIRERRTPGSMDVAASFNNLGNVEYSRGALPAAQDFYVRALAIRERLAPDSSTVADTVHNLGNVASDRGELAAAEQYYSRALSIRTRLEPESLVIANHLGNLGVVAEKRGDLAAAREYQLRALNIRERLAPNSLGFAISLDNLGLLEAARGDLTAAARYQQRALAIRERLAPDSLHVASSLNSLGNIARDRGDLPAAQDYHRRALSLRERLSPNALSVAGSLNNLGNVAMDRGDLAAAQDYYRRALAIQARLAPNSFGEATALNNLGQIAWLSGDPPRALDYHSRALGIRERLAPDSLLVAGSLDSLGEATWSAGDLSGALAYHSRALEIRERLAPDSLALAFSLHNLGLVARSRGDRTGWRSYHERALTLRERRAPNSLAVATSLESLGTVAFEEQRFSDALPLYTRAVDIVEAQRWQVHTGEARALLLARNTQPHDGLLRTYLALNDVPRAFAASERARARSLLDVLSEGPSQIRQGVDPHLLERERTLQQQLNVAANRRNADGAAAGDQLEALLIGYREVQAEIRAKSPRYASLTQPQPLGLREIQQQVLDDDTLLLEYVLGEEGGAVFAVTATSITSADLPKRATIEKTARQMYELVAARQPIKGETLTQREARIRRADADYPAIAADLSRMVLGPVAGQLPGKRLLIVADGALQYVPFAALPEPMHHDQTTTEPGQPLIVNHEIVHLPSASILAVMRQQSGHRQPATRLVAVVADPVFSPQDARLKSARLAQRATSTAAALPGDVERAARSAGLLDERGSLSRLPFTRDEADAILALVPRGQGTRVVDFRANRAVVTSADLSGYRVVHLATHGLLDAEHPELSGIVLSLVDEDGAAQDGFLRLHEVYNLNWPAELVVLSACQTALGKEIRGEGLVGLTRGFMYAGAERVLASLWNVNDGATAQFMKRFYQGLITQGLRPAAALRAAQVEMRKRQAWRAPYYWAPFVLQGEWK